MLFAASPHEPVEEVAASHPARGIHQHDDARLGEGAVQRRLEEERRAIRCDADVVYGVVLATQRLVRLERLLAAETQIARLFFVRDHYEVVAGGGEVDSLSSTGRTGLMYYLSSFGDVDVIRFYQNPCYWSLEARILN